MGIARRCQAFTTLLHILKLILTTHRIYFRIQGEKQICSSCQRLDKMSALGSSVISKMLHNYFLSSTDGQTDKSNTKIKPKVAPTRRAQASTETAASVSIDRQVPSGTSQPNSALHGSKSSAVPTPSFPHSAPAAIVTTTQAAVDNINSVSQNAQISIEGEPETETVASIQSRNRPKDSHAVSIPIPSTRAPSSVKNTPAALPVSQPNLATPAAQASISSHSIQPTRISEAGESVAEQSEQPAAKRRRIQPPQQKAIPADAATAQVDKALPTTDTTGSSTRNPQAPVLTPPPSQVYSQPIRTATEPSPPVNKTGKKRLSATAKGKQRVTENVPADIVLDAARGPTVEKTSPAKARKRRAPRKDTVAQPEDDANEESAAEPKEKRKKRKKREVTPENAEDVRIDPMEVLMSELTQNLRTGRKSTREAQLQEMEQENKAKRKQQRVDKRNGVTIEEHPGTDETPAETTDQRLERLAPHANEARHAVPEAVIVDGQIVIDDASLLIDRHALAAAERNAEQLESVEENDLTRRVTQATWGKRDKSGGWGELLTDQFYDGLRMFGTDFNMISKMFPGRTRHSVKLKFNKEERDDPIRIERALKGDRMPVDMAEFQKMTNTVYDDPKELEKELEEDRKRIEEEEATAKAALDEVVKHRADDAAAEAEAADKEAMENDSSAKENQNAKGGKEDEAEAPSQAKGAKRKKAVKSKELTARQRNTAQNKVVKKAAAMGKGRVKKAKDALGIGSTVVPGV